ncbi:MAG: hypothetical protein EOO89_26420 [Pedobacter sp.]|nr:MAG: hypothetical protein EOO89_26420 [Pedobacter sp.]
MRPGDIPLYNDIRAKLQTYKAIRPLPGIDNPQNEECFVLQLIDSVRRVKYVRLISESVDSPITANPLNAAFDPIKAAAWHHSQGNINEAFWLVFLSTHFGKNLNTKWNLVRDVYSGLTDNIVWNWENVCADRDGFLAWLNANQDTLRARGKVGNHRKYQSLDAYNANGTGSAINSYIDWIGENHNHQELIDNALDASENDPKRAFRHLYNSMNAVKSFGRMARFDYLTMIGKLNLINIVPDSTYMTGATGPVTGARILFGQNVNSTTFEEWFTELDEHLGLEFGMQILEDAVCNWQKNTANYIHFKG